jgi:hypothetical protein
MVCVRGATQPKANTCSLLSSRWLLIAGMAAGADSIDDMGVLRHGAVEDLFGGVRAPSTLGSFLRSFTWGSVRQLEACARLSLAAAAPLLPGREVLAFIDIDSMRKRVYGHAKAGAAFGYTKIQGKSLLVRWSQHRSCEGVDGCVFRSDGRRGRAGVLGGDAAG